MTSGDANEKSILVPFQRFILEVEEGDNEEEGAEGASIHHVHFAITEGLVGRVSPNDRIYGVGQWRVEGAGWEGEDFSIGCFPFSPTHPLVLVSSLHNIDREPKMSEAAVQQSLARSAEFLHSVKQRLYEDFEANAAIPQGLAVNASDKARCDLFNQLLQHSQERPTDLRDLSVTMAMVEGFCSQRCPAGVHHTLRLHLLLSLCSGGDIDERSEEEEVGLNAPRVRDNGTPSHPSPGQARNYRLHVLCLSGDPIVERIARQAMEFHPHPAVEVGVVPSPTALQASGASQEQLIAVIAPSVCVDSRGKVSGGVDVLLRGGEKRLHKNPSAGKAKANITRNASTSSPSSLLSSLHSASPSTAQSQVLWWLSGEKGGTVRKGKKVQHSSSRNTAPMCVTLK